MTQDDGELKKILQSISKSLGEIADGETKGIKKNLRKTIAQIDNKIKDLEQIESLDDALNKMHCSSCDNTVVLCIPVAGSGTEVSYHCIPCIEAKQIKILPEYIEKYGIKTEAL